MTSDPTKIIQRLTDAIRQNGEFPGMAKTLESISVLTASEGTSATALGDAILRDYGLTQIVLRMVNTVAYAQREPVATVSRAVVVMGFERIRDIAAGMLIMENLLKQARTERLADALAMSFFSAALARNIAGGAGEFHPEEAFIAGLLHRLGKLLLAFYLPKDYEAISEIEPPEQDAAVRQQLGASFADIGTGVAKVLSLPESLVQVMHRVVATDAHRQFTTADRLACLATMANDITDVLASGYRDARKRATAGRLVEAYGQEITVHDRLDVLVGQTLEDFGGASTGFGPNVRDAKVITRIVKWHVDSAVADGPEAREQTAAPETPGAHDPALAGVRLSAEAALARSLTELTAFCASDVELPRVLEMVLERIHHGLAVDRTRVCLLLVDEAAGVARFRVGFGHAQDEAAAWAEIPVRGSGDLFALAITQQKDLVIRDARIAQVAQSLPRWFTKGGVPDRFMVLLPVVMHGRSVGLVYLDGPKEHGVVLTPGVLELLKALRTQAALAIAQRVRVR